MTRAVLRQRDLNIGDYVCFSPDVESQPQDRNAGYTVPISIGRIVEMSEPHVKVWWLFAKEITAKWIEWRRLDKTRYIDTMNKTDLWRSNGKVIRLQMKLLSGRLGVDASLELSNDSLALVARLCGQ